MLEPTTSLSGEKWYVLRSPRFSLYATRETESLARYGLEALEEAYPAFSVLLGVHLENEAPLRPIAEENIRSRFNHIPVIINSAVSGGGFANPVTQNIELKIAEGSGAALFQHELSHRMMYEHMDPKLGAGGRVFTLAMTPTWWIEGLPELLTESVGRLETLGVARSMALNNAFPNWDRLHSLYQIDSYDTYLRGYVTSGRFFRYLASDPRMPDLYALHRKLFTATLIPPFITAEDLFFIKEFGMVGSSYYAEFQEFERAHWKSLTQGVLQLSKAEEQPFIFRSEGTTYVDEIAGGFVSSDLRSEVYPSAVRIRTLTKNGAQTQRVPADARGSSRTRSRTFSDGTTLIWSLTNDRDRAGKRVSNLVRIELKRGLFQTTEIAQNQSSEFTIDTRLASFQVADFLILDRDKVGLLLNSAGKKSFVYFDYTTQKFTELASWDMPSELQIVRPAPGKDLKCAHFLIDSDKEKTRIDRVCLDPPQSRNVVPEKLFSIVSAAEYGPHALLLLVGWRDMLGFVRYNVQTGGYEAFAPVADWLGGLQPAMGSDNQGAAEYGKFYVWQHFGNGYGFREFSAEKLRLAYAQAKTDKKIALEYASFPAWKEYIPPFKQMAQRVLAGKRSLEQRTLEGRHARAVEQGQGATETQPLPAVLKPKSSSEAAFVPAPYTYDHWFTYPQARPSFFGGPSVGLVSIPFRDEMERYQLTVLGDYSFDTEKTNLSVVYLSRRVLEQLSFEVFSRERFNGLYYLYPCSVDSDRYTCASQKPVRLGSKRFHYLRENGFTLGTVVKFKPSSAALSLSAGLARLTPSVGMRVPTLGPQFLNLLTLNSALSFEIFEKGFYLAAQEDPSGEFLLWRTTSELSVAENVSIGDVQDGQGQIRDTREGGAVEGPVHFQDLGISALSTINFYRNQFNLRGSLGRTLGENTLNRRQVFSPYRTYLLGSGSALNRVNVPIPVPGSGTSSLFSYQAGNWMYRTTIDYSRRVFDKIDKRLFILFLESIDFELVAGRGGVAYADDLSDANAIDSVSVATRVNIDLKGFKIFPALAWGKVIGEEGWSLFAELSFSDFF